MELKERARQRVEVVVPRREYWKAQINCQAACPVHTDARGYVRAIAEGEDELAYLIARGPNPLASMCGRVCGAPCEVACRRGELDRPIAIRALKRFVCEQFGPEIRDETGKGEGRGQGEGEGKGEGKSEGRGRGEEQGRGRGKGDEGGEGKGRGERKGDEGRDEEGGEGLIAFLKEAARRYGPRLCEDVDELLPLLQGLLRREIEPVKGLSVGIIGSGPAGLSCAHDLALLGFSVTLYEMEPVLAGMLAVGIPDYRLSRELIRAEVEVIRQMGVKAVTHCRVGQDLAFPELRQRHDAVVIAVGAKSSRALSLPGAEAENVLGGVEYLREVALGQAPSLGQRVVVIGGGNVAYDVGRTVVRQIAYDAARTALRQEGDQVYLCSLESLDEMPADDVEILEGEEEGIIRKNSLGPIEIEVDKQGRARSVLFQKCLRVYDEERRFAPLFDETQRERIACDSVLVCVGQAFQVDFIEGERDEIEVNERGQILCDPESGRTSASDVFVAGDLAYGTRLMIHAIASGKRIAREIYSSLSGRPLSFRDIELHLSLHDYQREKNYEQQRRVAIPLRSVEERLSAPGTPVEIGYNEEQARTEAGRCLDCGINTIFDGERCILCGGCVDVCPERCLRIVSVDRLVEEEGAPQVLPAHLGEVAPEEASAILKDETICIRCALCAERCPTGAITMERFHFQEIPLCPTD